jgi:hypothetical protein
MAWTATCGSLAHAWMAMSPPLRSGSRSSPGKCGSGRNASGDCLASPKRSLPSGSRNRLGPNPMVTVSWEGGSPADRAAFVVTAGDDGDAGGTGGGGADPGEAEQAAP